MSIFELDAKVDELRELRRNTDVLSGNNCLVTWKTVTSRRFDSASFKLTHADLFNQYTKATTNRRLVIA